MSSREVKQYPLKRLPPLREPLYYGFPREITLRRLRVSTAKEFMGIVDRLNGSKELVTTLYTFRDWHIVTGRPLYETARITKIFFDLDGQRKDDRDENGKQIKDPERARDDARAVVNWCIDNDYRSVFAASGNGYHAYLWLKHEPKFGKPTLRAATKYLNNSYKFHLDTGCVGDVARMPRIMGTYNLKAKKYMVSASWDEILSDAPIDQSKKNYKIIYQGTNLLDISEWDVPTNVRINEHGYTYDPRIDLNYKPVNDLKELLTSAGLPEHFVPPCIKKAFLVKEMPYAVRSTLIYFFKKMALTPAEIENVMALILSPDKFNHMMTTHFEASMRNSFSPSCEPMKDFNICENNCPATSPYQFTSKILSDIVT